MLDKKEVFASLAALAALKASSRGACLRLLFIEKFCLAPEAYIHSQENGKKDTQNSDYTNGIVPDKLNKCIGYLHI